MKLSNLYRIGTPILIITLMLSMMAGCAYDAVLNQSNEEISAIEHTWDTVIKNENNSVTKMELTYSVVQSPYSSVIQPSKKVLLDEEQMDLVIHILSEQQFVWEVIMENSDETTVYPDSRYGQKRILIAFFDSDNKCHMRLNVYEDNICYVLCEPDIISDTQVIWKKSAWSGSSNNIYKLLEELMNGLEQ